MFPTHFSLAEILVLAGTASAGRMAPPASTRISAWLKRIQEHGSPVNVEKAATPPRHESRSATRVVAALQGSVLGDKAAMACFLSSRPRKQLLPTVNVNQQLLITSLCVSGACCRAGLHAHLVWVSFPAIG